MVRRFGMMLLIGRCMLYVRGAVLALFTLIWLTPGVLVYADSYPSTRFITSKGMKSGTVETAAGFKLFGILLVAAAVVAIGIRLFKHRGKWKLLILKEEMIKDKSDHLLRQRTDLLGKSGLALTPLRPSGTIAVEDERVDVVTYGEFIPINKQVVVVQVEGSRIRVREEHEVVH
jgi:membrane-bound ClpP family serine protease